MGILHHRNIVKLRADKLQAEGESLIVKSGRNADRRQAGEIGGNRKEYPANTFGWDRGWSQLKSGRRG